MIRERTTTRVIKVRVDFLLLDFELETSAEGCVQIRADITSHKSRGSDWSQ
jgi:hypothetical protein